MTPVELLNLKRTYGDRDGVIAYWQATDAENARRACEAMDSLRGTDLFEDAVESLLTKNSQSILDTLETGDPQQISSWVKRDVRQKLSENSNADRAGARIKKHEIFYGDIRDSDADLAYTENVEAIVIHKSRDQMVLEAFSSIPDIKIRCAMLERVEYGTSYDKLGKKYFPKISAQAAEKKIKKHLAVVELYLRGLGAGEGCGEISAHLLAASWRLDELDEAVQTQVVAHLSHCAACRAEVQTQRRAVVQVGAFVPFPVFLALTAGHEQAAGFFDSIWASANARYAELMDWIRGLAANPPRTGATVAAVAVLAGGTAAGVHKVTGNEPAKGKKQKADAAVITPHLLDRVDVPPVDRDKPKKKRKKKAPAQAPAPVQTPAPAPTTSQPKQTQRVEDGSSEFLPEAR